VFVLSGHFRAFLLSLVCDDGAVVYINGVQVYSLNMPVSGAITFRTAALTARNGIDETTPVDVALPASAFVLGENVIAVSVHNSGLTSSDMRFDAQLQAEPLPSPSPSPPAVIDNVLVRRRSLWTFHQDTSTPPRAPDWTTPAFDDASWASGVGVFGFGDGQPTRVVAVGSPPISAYFRTVFVVPFVERVAAARVNLLRDDGCV
jgi:hypothetical protein